MAAENRDENSRPSLDSSVNALGSGQGLGNPGWVKETSKSPSTALGVTSPFPPTRPCAGPASVVADVACADRRCSAASGDSFRVRALSSRQPQSPTKQRTAACWGVAAAEAARHLLQSEGLESDRRRRNSGVPQTCKALPVWRRYRDTSNYFRGIPHAARASRKQKGV